MAGKGGRKEKREAKLRDIMQDAQGNVVYTGDLYRISESSEAGGKQRQKMLLILGLVLLVLIVTGSGCIDADNAMGSFYVVLPYIGEVSALFGLVWNAVKILYPSDGVRTYVLEHSRSRIPAACRILSVFAVISFVLSLIYMIRNGQEIYVPLLEAGTNWYEAKGSSEFYMDSDHEIRVKLESFFTIKETFHLINEGLCNHWSSV